MQKIVNIAEMLENSHQGSYVTELRIFYCLKGGLSTAITFKATYNSQPIVRENQFD